jgi:tRNA(fMet)-specific endonuclease VapC
VLDQVERDGETFVVERRGRAVASIAPAAAISGRAITAAELLVGVHLAERRRRAARREYADALMETIPVESYDLEVARVHAAMLWDVRKGGRARGAHDLLIAATARARDRIVVTADATGFDDLPEVRVRVLPANR